MKRTSVIGISIKLQDQDKRIIDDSIADPQNAEWKKRLKIIRLIGEAVPPSELAKFYNITETTVKRYIKMYNEGGLEALKPIKQTEHNIESEFVICVKNDDYPESLKIMKAYQTIFDAKAIKHKLIRVIDETGEDYLYSQEYFVPVSLPSDANEILTMVGQT